LLREASYDGDLFAATATTTTATTTTAAATTGAPSAAFIAACTPAAAVTPVSLAASAGAGAAARAAFTGVAIAISVITVLVAACEPRVIVANHVLSGVMHDRRITGRGCQRRHHHECHRSQRDCQFPHGISSMFVWFFANRHCEHLFRRRN
jgi:hypothetical protein